MRCVHTHSRLVKIVAVNEAEMFACQCVVCGNKATTWLPKKLIKCPEGVALESSKPPTISALLADNRAALEEMKRAAYRVRRSFYDQYLQSPQWQTFRRVIFARCNGVCEVCGVRRSTQVHHKTYERLGNESLGDLMGVCGPCHEALHAREEEDACS